MTKIVGNKPHIRLRTERRGAVVSVFLCKLSICLYPYDAAMHGLIGMAVIRNGFH